MKDKINKVISSTNGYKTKTAVIVRLLVMILGDKIPFIAENEETVVVSIDALLLSGLLHDVWRNRKEIGAWIKNVFNKNK